MIMELIGLPCIIHQPVKELTKSLNVYVEIVIGVNMLMVGFVLIRKNRKLFILKVTFITLERVKQYREVKNGKKRRNTVKPFININLP